MADVKMTSIYKSFGNTEVIHGVDLEVEDHEFVVFVGPSGCGKSTLLRLVAGLEDVTQGEIEIDGQRVDHLPPAKRGIAMVFQSYALYPHMTVYKNMAFGLKQAKTPKDEIDQRVRNAAEILEISSLLDRTPKALSGGQRQRVAIGRAIVREPEVFLFDEPLSNLDAALRVQTRIEIARLHERLGTTMIYVTHDQVEAMTLADKIVVLRDGNIEQIGSPIELYRNPSNMFVAQFIGSPKMNFFDSDDLTDAGRALINSRADILGIRPEHFIVVPTGSGVIQGKPNLVEPLGEYALVHCETVRGSPFIVKTTDPENIKKGSVMSFDVDPAVTHRFDQLSQGRIV